MNKLIKQSLLNALGTIAYIAIVATIMQSAEKFLGNKPDTIFAPIAFLSLFILSAAITGSLVIGKPLLLFLSGSKQEAVKLFLYTLGWLAIATVILFILNFA